MAELVASVGAVAVIVVAWGISEMILRARQKHAAARVANRCHISGCDNRAYCTVAKADTTLDVCYPCRDEMTALFGWTETGPLREEAS